MKSKSEIIREHLNGKAVIDIGGSGYGEDNDFEKDLAQAWSTTSKRFTIDISDRADMQCDLNKLPHPEIPNASEYDITTAFDVIEHIHHPVDLLEWVPTGELLISLPNALSPIARKMESGSNEHIYSFTTHTAGNLLKRAGWKVESKCLTFGKWSFTAKMINILGSIYPPITATGIMLFCIRD